MFSSSTSQVATTGVIIPEAVDFDGTNDYLSRATPTGSATSKTFTLSFFAYRDTSVTTARQIFRASNTTTGSGTTFYVSAEANNLFILCRFSPTDSSGEICLQLETPVSGELLTKSTFINVLLSVDLTSTSRRFLYINDVLQSPTWTTYSNAAVDFVVNNYFIAGISGLSTARFKGRLSNFFLDYTYRDLSITGNRRLFVDADLNPAAGQPALNPIIYLPMSDPTQPGLNQGTGGNFALTGVVARSGRGPNQYNAPFSTLSNPQHLSRTTAPTGLADSKQFTFQCSFYGSNLANRRAMLSISASGPNQTLGIYIDVNRLVLYGRNSALTEILYAIVTNPTFIDFRNYTVTVSVNLANPAQRHIYINGVAATSVTWTSYTDDIIDLVPGGPIYNIGALSSTGDYWSGQLGPVWFNPSYIDLSAPGNLDKFVTGTGINAKPVDPGASGELPTGTSPILYFPMYGNDAGKNYGTGGNFTVNSGPYTGARGPNEFWGNRVRFTSSSTFLRRSSLLSNSKTFSFSCYFSKDVDSAPEPLFQITSGGTVLFNVLLTGSSIRLLDSVNNGLFSDSPTTFVNNRVDNLFICIDMADTSKRFVYHNGVLLSTTWNLYPDQAVSLAGQIDIGLYGTANYFAGTVSQFYLTTTYIDFNQEATRLKFIDAFSNPVDLTQQIEAGAIPNPQAYMRFPPTAFGTNSGTGGNFTVNGTPTDGGQI